MMRTVETNTLGLETSTNKTVQRSKYYGFVPEMCTYQERQRYMDER